LTLPWPSDDGKSINQPTSGCFGRFRNRRSPLGTRKL
jgi:hypothetical protein